MDSLESPAESNHSYYNFDPVMFTLYDKDGMGYLRYHFYIGGEITGEVPLARLDQSGFDDVLQKIASREFPVHLKIGNKTESLHFKLKQIDHHGYIKGNFVVKVFGWLPIKGSRVNIRKLSLENFVGDLKKGLTIAV